MFPCVSAVTVQSRVALTSTRVSQQNIGKLSNITYVYNYYLYAQLPSGAV